MIKQQFNALLTKEMNRRDFLKYSGGILLAAVGVTGMVRLLLGQAGIGHTDGSSTAPVQAQQNSASYGGSVYGG